MLHKYTLSFDKTRIHYIIKRNKNKHFLVFVHGVGVNWTIWKKQIEFFDYAGYSYIAIDLRGHGLSDRPSDEKKYLFTHFTKDVLQLLKKEQIKEFSLIGHSLGGGVAIDFLTQFKKKPKTVVVLDTAVISPFQEKTVLNMNKIISRFLRFITKHQKIKQQKNRKEVDLSVAYSKNKVLTAVHWLQQCPLKVIITVLDNLEKHIQTHSQRSIKALKQLKRPMLVITSLFDNVVPAKHSEDISRYAPNTTFKIIKDVSHTVMLDKPNEVNTTILKFLEKRMIKQYF